MLRSQSEKAANKDYQLRTPKLCPTMAAVASGPLQLLHGKIDWDSNEPGRGKMLIEGECVPDTL
jgi:hypothetical protein